MKLSSKFLATASVAALAALVSVPASADVAATVSGSYANIDVGPGSADVWGGNGALTGMFADNWGGEADLSYHNISGAGSTDIWSFGGNVFWRGMDTRVAASVMYHDITGGNATNYGLGAEWFAGDSVTLAIKGGGISGSGANGGYVGGDVKWYAMPNLAFDGRVDYADQGVSTTTETLQAEWLFSEDTPVSIYGGYQHVDVGGLGGNGNVWFVGIKLYANGGNGTLVDRQRSGTLGYLSQSPVFIDQY
ncbi:MAG TPA: hypothetical protein VHL34_20295 [Rhizomicrobium sp.]|nr:hypothetical protein [Rhizomicrobium sp.]